MFKKPSRRILEDSTISRFFSPPWPFGENVIFGQFWLNYFFFGVNAYFWCPGVRLIIKNTSRGILKCTLLLVPAIYKPYIFNLP